MKTLAGTTIALRRSMALLATLACAAFPAAAQTADAPAARQVAGGPMTQYVRVSPRDARYLELSDGTPYIPNGLNVIHPSGDVPTEAGLVQMERWMKAPVPADSAKWLSATTAARHGGTSIPMKR